MQVLAIRKAEGIEDIVRNQATLDTGEERKEIKVEGSLLFEGFESLFKQYKCYLDTKIDFSRPFEKIGRLPVLSPKQANAFLQATIEYETNENYALNTGCFMSAILQKSYNAGHHKFKFTTKSLTHKIDGFAYLLIATEKKPIEIIINGSIGDRYCWYGKNITIHAESIGNRCGSYGNKITIHAENIGNDCGFGGHNIKAHAQNVGNCYGWYGSNITIHAESIGNDCGRHGENITAYAESFGKDCGSKAKNSTFKTSNKETLRWLKKSVAQNKGNRIYYIHADGTEEECKF